MKKIIIFVALIGVFVSCNDLTELNDDPKNPQEIAAGPLAANAMVAMFDFMTSTNVNENNFRLWSQHWAQTTYADESNYELTERNVNGRMWTTMYATVNTDLAEAKSILAEDRFLTESQKAAQTAILDAIQVYAFHVLVDVFGDIPYSEAFTEDVTPSYDDDQAVYSQLISRLNSDISNIADNTGMDYDLIYGGDGSKWRKFANSLKLRLAIRIADVNPGEAQSLAEAAVSGGVMESSADDFELAYESAPPNTNPLWVDLVQSGRSDFVAANTLVDVMNERNDPRRPFYFSGPMDDEGNPIGGVPGSTNAYNAHSHAGLLLEDPTFPGELLSYTEVQFLLADAAERGWNVGGTAEEFYNEGIGASILEWGGTEEDVAAYLAQPSVAYDSAEGDWKAKIAMQKWIALYNRGFEAWNTYKLYDALPMKKAQVVDLYPPFRYIYPESEYSLNEENVTSASSSIGGDNLTSKVFWDVN